VTSAAADAAGHHWQYSTDGGVSWINMDSASTTAALYLNPSDLVHWTGGAGTNTPFSAVAVDNTEAAAFDTTATGHLNVSVTGGSTPFSAIAATLAANMAPIVLDMNHDGQLSYTTENMDVNGNGHVYTTAWAGGGDGVLVWNKYGDGQVHNSSQFAFSQYGAAGSTDLQGLAAAFDTNHDGVFNAQDGQFKNFGVWIDSNHNGVVDAGEMTFLSAAGITSISLTSNHVISSPVAGVTTAGETSATLADGSSMIVADDSFGYTVASTIAGSPSGSAATVGVPPAGVAGAGVFQWHLAEAASTEGQVSHHWNGMLDVAGQGANAEALDLRDLLQAGPSATSLEGYLSPAAAGAGAKASSSATASGAASPTGAATAHDAMIDLHSLHLNAGSGLANSHFNHVIQNVI
jgi:hypothetical protein